MSPADLVIRKETLRKVQMTAEELRLELAIFLYAQEKLSIGQARHLAGLDHISFQKALAKRNVYLHLDWEDVEEDLQNLGKLP